MSISRPKTEGEIDQPPASLAKLLGEPNFETIPGWETKPIWTFDLPSTGTAILKFMGSGVAYFEWQISLMEQLVSVGVPANRPLPLLAGETIHGTEAGVWATFSFLAGEAVGWTEPPSLQKQGEAMARFHLAVAALDVPPRPDIGSIDRFIADTLPNHPATEEVVATLRRLRDSGTQIIHGDLSCDNMLALDGEVVGFIDFGMAQHHHPVVDLGFALQRTARLSRNSLEFDPVRITRFLDGYLNKHPMSSEYLRALPEAMIAKGLFLLALMQRGSRAWRQADVEARTNWLIEHRTLIADAIAAAI